MMDPKLEYISDRLKEWYDITIEILDTYMDIDAEDKEIVALWSLAMNFKDSFYAIPYIFLNAAKGSGKTRLLKIFEKVISHAKATPNLTEASLIRLPSQQKLNVLLIDEAERITSKEKATLRELFNQAYKRGGVVLRVEESKEKQRVVKEYPVFLGICLANIWGLEPVLEDRCISITLRTSNNPSITKIPEMFEFDERFRLIKQLSLVYEVCVGQVISSVSEYLFKSLLYNYTLPTLHTHNTLPTQHTQQTLIEQPLLTEELFRLPTNVDFILDNIMKSSLVARDFELWFPLILTASLISKEFMLEIVSIAEKKCSEKRAFEIMEDRDTIFAIFLGYYLKANGNDMMIPIKRLKEDFVKIEEEKRWLSVEWIGRCLKRLNVIQNKRRLAKGFEVEINNIRLEDFLLKRGIIIDETKLDEYRMELAKEISRNQKKFTDYEGGEN